MRILDRYICKHVIAGTAIALAILVALFSIVDLVDDIESVGQGDYTMARAMEYLVLRVPGRLFALLPVSALIGSVMGLGTLTSSSELTVMRASGVSVGQITGSVMKAGALLVVVAIAIGELIVPTSEQLAHQRRSVALTQQITLQTDYGLWVRDGLSFINIRKVLPNSELEGVYIYEFDERYRLRMATLAERAVYGEDGWQLQGISQSEIGDDGVTKRHIDQAVWHSLLGPDQVSAVPIRPEGLSVIGLLTYLRFLADNGLSTSRYELALWNKFVYPLATAVMVFVSVVLVLGPLRAVSLGRRVVFGIVIGVVFHIVQKTTMHAGLVFEGSPWLTVLGPPLAFLGFGLWMMRRIG